MRWAVNEIEEKVPKKPEVVVQKEPQPGDKRVDRKFAWTPVLTLDKKTKIWLEHYEEVHEFKTVMRYAGVGEPKERTLSILAEHRIPVYDKYELRPTNKWILIKRG